MHNWIYETVPGIGYSPPLHPSMANIPDGLAIGAFMATTVSVLILFCRWFLQWLFERRAIV